MISIIRQAVFVFLALAALTVTGTLGLSQISDSAVREVATSLITASATIFAGWLAVSAVRLQLDSATAEKQEAFNALNLDLKDVLELINEVWRTIDHARGAPAGEFADRAAIVSTTASSAQQVIPFNVFEQMSKELRPMQRRALGDVLKALKWVEADITRLTKGNIAEGYEHHIRTTWIMLSHLREFVRKYDPQLAEVFAGRNSSHINHDNMAKLIRPFVDENLK